MPFIEARRSWERRFSRTVLLLDLLAVSLAVGVTQLLWWDTYWSGSITLTGVLGEVVVGYPLVTLLLVLVWWLPLTAPSSRHPRVLADAAAPARRVVGVTAAVFGTFAVTSYLLKLEIGRSFLLTALPIGIVLLLAVRAGARLWLRRARRRRSGYAYRTVLVGERDNAVHVAERMSTGAWAGHLVVGIVTPGMVDDEQLAGAPVLNDSGSITEVARAAGADTVIICGSDELTPAALRRLGWELASLGINLIIAPTLTGVAGTRLHLQPVGGLPLLHVDYPASHGRRAIAKRFVDILGASAILLLASPVMLAVALGVKLSSRGPVLYRQERIGRGGRTFGMLKFRSMVPGADAQLAALLEAQGSSDQPLFKVTDDPRVTPIGRVLRKYSLDEFPQLLNVLGGSMSLVGPRPQRQQEVALYTQDAHRRLLVKPGMSGLWQVSGRSSLSWDDAIDLDLYYVENWSAAGDLLILAKTFRAVVAPGVDAH